MSVENLKEYARRCANDSELRAKAKAIGLTDMDAHMRQSRSLDLDWTQSDMAAFRKEMIDAEGDLDDLSEGELEQIAGGVVSAVAAVVVGTAVAVGVGAGVAAGAAAGSAAGGTSAASGDGGW